jgi:hypothetical protein
MPATSGTSNEVASLNIDDVPCHCKRANDPVILVDEGYGCNFNLLARPTACSSSGRQQPFV